jgi:hypothetical protein
MLLLCLINFDSPSLCRLFVGRHRLEWLWTAAPLLAIGPRGCGPVGRAQQGGTRRGVGLDEISEIV